MQSLDKGRYADPLPRFQRIAVTKQGRAWLRELLADSETPAETREKVRRALAPWAGVV